MVTRTQWLAAQAYEQVCSISGAPGTEQRRYGSMAHKLPVLVRKAGLAQALAFVQSRGTPEGILVAHLAEVVGEPALLARSRTAELAEYMRLTRNVLAALEWYTRFAQEVLGVDRDADDEGSPNE